MLARVRVVMRLLPVLAVGEGLSSIVHSHAGRRVNGRDRKGFVLQRERRRMLSQSTRKQMLGVARTSTYPLHWGALPSAATCFRHRASSIERASLLRCMVSATR